MINFKKLLESVLTEKEIPATKAKDILSIVGKGNQNWKNIKNELGRMTFGGGQSEPPKGGKVTVWLFVKDEADEYGESSFDHEIEGKVSLKDFDKITNKMASLGIPTSDDGDGYYSWSP